MATTAHDLLTQVLQERGFVRDGQPSPGLLDAARVDDSATKSLRYHHILTASDDPSYGNAPIDLVYEIPNMTDDIDAPGTPCIYFKALDDPSDGTVRTLRQLVWNQGRAPLLCIATHKDVRIYDSIARPQADDTDDTHLVAELRHIGDHLQGLQEFSRDKFDSGAFWKTQYGQRIERGQRVDAAMLDDLSATENLLISAGPPLPSEIAHALLGRAIFVKYLEDRGLLTPLFFADTYGYDSFTDLLSDHAATYSFFAWLRATFNGDLFPLEPDEEDTVKQSPHLRLVQQFLLGTDVRTGQMRLWPYRFDIIPVELISSIYEMFIHARDLATAETTSVHYTRLVTVELLLSVAMKGTTHTARVLDPACGSGVFLVEAFRRLAWLRAKEYGRRLHRDELHELLQSQIFGIDIDRDAVRIAAFSLYLTLLELDPEPQPLSDLRFPPLMFQPNRTSSSMADIPNLYVQDTCNTQHNFNRNAPFAQHDFDIIVGNAPWTSLKADAPRDPEDPISGRRWSWEYCQDHDIPDNKIDQAFLWRVRDFAGPQTRIALIVCSRLFYQESNRPVSDRFLDKFLSTNTIESVVNLSDLIWEKVLFGGASTTKLPASIIVYRANSPEASNDVLYITPKWYPTIRRQQSIVLLSDDINTISQRLLQETPWLWKSAFRGTPRDYRLLCKLQGLRSLEQLLADLGIEQGKQRSLGLTVGLQQQKFNPDLIDIPYLASGSKDRYAIDSSQLAPFGYNTVARRSSNTLLEEPVLLLHRSLDQGEHPLRVAVVESSTARGKITFSRMYYGISFRQAPAIAYRLNAILNSKLAYYMAFMFSSNLGWDRQLIEMGDWFQTRLPTSIVKEPWGDDENKPFSSAAWVEILGHEQRLREAARLGVQGGADVAAIQDELDRAIFDLYDLSEQEVALVEDTLRFGIDLYRNRYKRGVPPNALQSPREDDLMLYARCVATQLDELLGYSEMKLIATVCIFANDTNLCACRFRANASGDARTIDIAHLNGTEDILDNMSRDLRAKVADHLYVRRDLRVYVDDGFWIIKPAQKRLWSRAAALNDADSVLRDHLDITANGFD